MRIYHILKKIFDSYVYSNINISLAAACYALVSYIQFNSLQPMQNKSLQIDTHLILLIFCATFCSYSFHRIFPILNKSLKFESKIINWTKRNLRLMLTCFFISGSVLFYIFIFQLNNTSKLLLCLLALTTVLYTFPLFKRKGSSIRLKDLAYSKIFLIGTTWGLVCSTLPMLDVSFINKSFSNQLFLLAFLEKCFFIIAITLPFDIRDLEYDKIEQVVTIPTKFGIQNTITIALILLGISFFIALSAYSLNRSQILAFTIAYLLTAIFIYASKRKQKDYFYFLYIDGMPIILILLLMYLA